MTHLEEQSLFSLNLVSQCSLSLCTDVVLSAMSAKSSRWQEEVKACGCRDRYARYVGAETFPPHQVHQQRLPAFLPTRLSFFLASFRIGRYPLPLSPSLSLSPRSFETCPLNLFDRNGRWTWTPKEGRKGGKRPDDAAGGRAVPGCYSVVS